jgi:YbgC/YbaW family acyl-CoA thioester hydrolase
LISHTYQFQVKEHHLDTFSHVNNATYLALFEEARWDWITNNGYGLQKIKETGFGPVVLEISISFKKELTLRQEVIINTEVLDNESKISKIRQVMLDEKGNVFCEAIFTFALFDLHKRKIASPTPEWQKALR